MTRNVYRSRGRHNRRVLWWTLVTALVLTAAAAGGLLVAQRVAGHDASPREAAKQRAAVVTPSPVPLRNVSVHRGRPATLTYRVTDRGQALRRVVIVIRKANGSIALSLHLGPQPPDRTLSHRLVVTLRPGTYTWFVRATAANGVARTSAQGDRLTVLAPLPPAFPGASATAGALEWAAARASQVGVAVIDSRGVLHGYDARQQFQSASLAKAMLLVAYLRRHPKPTAAMRTTLTEMLEDSDDASADAVFDVVGNPGLRSVARLAGMQDFAVGTSWIDTEMTAADQARFFYRYEDYLPAASVTFARSLLSGVTPIQRWGIPAAAGPAGWTVFFKGGWLDQGGQANSLVTQAAWLERGGVRWSLAVLTADDPTNSYGWQTQKGVTGLLLGHEPTAAYLAVVHQSDTSQ